ncbi:Uncharacterised protein [Vibrio cholerae]|nr:Uncharacterised protein [Vibrio cholerae]
MRNSRDFFIRHFLFQFHDVFECTTSTRSGVTSDSNDWLIFTTNLFPVGDFAFVDFRNLFCCQTFHRIAWVNHDCDTVKRDRFFNQSRFFFRIFQIAR